MLYIGLLVLAAVVLLIGSVFGALLPRGAKDDYDKESAATAGRAVTWATRIAVLLFVVGLTFGASIRQVPAGHVGLVYTFGNITGQRDAGINMVWPWQGFKIATIQVQTLCLMDESDEQNKHCPDGSKKVGTGLDSFSKETQNVYIDAIVNIEVSPSDVQNLYKRVGPTYVDKLIPGRVAQIFKDETVNYAAEALAPARETIRANVEEQLRRELDQYSIGVTALLVENIQFDPEFEASILARQNATIEAGRQRALVAAKEAEAQQLAATALGNANQLRIEAQGRADANRLLNETLNPLLVQWLAIQRLADNIQIALIPSGEGIILDPATLLGGAPAP